MKPRDRLTCGTTNYLTARGIVAQFLLQRAALLKEYTEKSCISTLYSYPNPPPPPSSPHPCARPHEFQALLSLLLRLVHRNRHAVLHDQLPFDPDSEAAVDQKLGLREPAMLAVFSLSADKSLLTPTKANDSRLRRILGATQESLHPYGTLVVLVPHPWYLHHGRIVGEAHKCRVGYTRVFSFCILRVFCSTDIPCLRR